ncbi:membrane-bound alkaline phosphatase isoform X2 [Acyrthosiphon pisum]|uniref:Alkaline phosphatase n=1 Tax=Acyrthosiphon pisum TaxID=7029 RepID=A0A8R2B8E4_ACYPI|nr:membrane-bound alkaline phosphatase isoform X2 [Acyrthosiphon pisum]|eukprot:XP_008186655.1 PREDICTED: membrane-bound alkaline phosphatase isoform X2 [Acyrthosiphon pisum]
MMVTGSLGATWISFACCLCFVITYSSRNVCCSLAANTGKEYTEQDRQYWIENAKAKVTEKVKYVNKRGVAKNIIMFLGDGMSLTTLTASRIYKGQMEKRSGENEYLSFEKFPFVGMSKTYCVDKQVADSACTATAYLTGVKANYETIGVSASVKLNDCPGSVAPGNRTQSIADWSMAAGKAVGLVTTTRVTHASPAGAYAHTAHRNWESDADLAKAANLTDVTQCEDIAKQLITRSPGIDIKVILGGGRHKFFLNDTDKKGSRRDMDLVEFWKKDKAERFGNDKSAYVENREQLLNVDPSKTDYLLGLFESKHMKYHLKANATIQPTLAEMTRKAIEILKKEENGFFLFVEGGLIDSAHHETVARLALDETVEFSKAVQQAVDMTSEDDTLIVVTSDHSHTMTMAGYPVRGNDILSLSGSRGIDELPYTTLSYANGPAKTNDPANTNDPQPNVNCARQDLSKVDTSQLSFAYPHMVTMKDYETHGGDDVMVFARGPWAHLFSGNYEQNLIPLTMGFAAGIGPAARVVGGSAAFTSAGLGTAAVSSPLAVLTGALLTTLVVRT